jgi:hypothetical protein
VKDFEDFEPILRPIKWRRISAINGRGELLLGSDELSIGPGAMVIAPPGVLLRGPKGGKPLTRNGWRQARWGPDGEGNVLVDQAPPKALIEVDLGQVVEDLSGWAPEHLVWVAGIVERNMRVLIGRMRRDCRGVLADGYERAFEELTELHRGADEAFARVRNRREVPGWLTEGHFSGMRHAYLLTLSQDEAAHKRAEPDSSHSQVSR